MTRSVADKTLTRVDTFQFLLDFEANLVEFCYIPVQKWVMRCQRSRRRLVVSFYNEYSCKGHIVRGDREGWRVENVSDETSI